MRRIARIATALSTLAVLGAGAPAALAKSLDPFWPSQDPFWQQTPPYLPPIVQPNQPVILVPPINPGTTGRGQLPEIRSYRPYSGSRPNLLLPPTTTHGTITDTQEIVPPIPLLPQAQAPAPFTADWFAYCAEKYRSFEPSTGTYTTYGGARRVCR